MKNFMLRLKEDLQCENARYNAIFLSIVMVIFIICGIASTI